MIIHSNTYIQQANCANPYITRSGTGVAHPKYAIEEKNGTRALAQRLAIKIAFDPPRLF